MHTANVPALSLTSELQGASREAKEGAACVNPVGPLAPYPGPLEQPRTASDAYRGRGEVGLREEGLQGPWGGGVTGGGATGAVGRWGDGRRAYRGRGEVG